MRLAPPRWVIKHCTLYRVCSLKSKFLACSSMYLPRIAITIHTNLTELRSDFKKDGLNFLKELGILKDLRELSPFLLVVVFVQCEPELQGTDDPGAIS